MRDGLKGERITEKERRNLDILSTVRRANEISRAEISRLTGLNIVTVSNYINAYVYKGLIEEGGLDISTGGRRPELVRIKPSYGYTIGIDLGAPHILEGTCIIGVVMDVSSRQVLKESVKKEEESAEKFIDRIIDLISRLIKDSNIPKEKFLGVGLGIWGVLDRYKGTVRYTPEKGGVFNYVELRNRIEKKFNLPATIEHDAMAAALGEKWAGIGLEPGVENILYICSDSSVGIIINGELYYGASKSAGELNLNPPDEGSDDTPEVKCWATYRHGCCLRSRGIDLGISDRAKSLFREKKGLRSLIMDAVDDDIDKITMDIVASVAEKGDKVAIKILEEAGDYLGVKIAALINIFNPEAVVIGRGIERAGDVFFEALRRSVERWAFEESVKVVRIRPTSLSDESVAVGAASLVTQKVFAKIG